MAKSYKNTIGSWAFLIGVVLAVILGFFPVSDPLWIALLVFLGLIIGLFNITDKETQPFLWSGLALIIASGIGGSVLAQVQVLDAILQNLLAIFTPATIIVAIKNVFTLARR